MFASRSCEWNKSIEEMIQSNIVQNIEKSKLRWNTLIKDNISCVWMNDIKFYIRAEYINYMNSDIKDSSQRK